MLPPVVTHRISSGGAIARSRNGWLWLLPQGAAYKEGMVPRS